MFRSSSTTRIRAGGFVIFGSLSYVTSCCAVQREPEATAVSVFTLHPSISAVSLRECLGNGEAEAGAAYGRARNPEEFLEEKRLILFGHADSCVGHFNPNRTVHLLGMHPN